MAFWDKEEILITVDKNKKEKIQVKLCERDKKPFVDVRILEYDNPTVRGATIPAKKFPEIAAAVLSRLESMDLPEDTAD